MNKKKLIRGGEEELNRDQRPKRQRKRVEDKTRQRIFEAKEGREKRELKRR